MNDRDPRSDLGAYLGEELRQAREAAGIESQEHLARELGFHRSVIVKAETGSMPPSKNVAPKIAERFPGLCNGLYVTLAAIARKSNGPVPGWFADWLEREGVATSLRIWQTIIVPGLFQTSDYARALFVGERKGIDSEDLEELVAARMARQAIIEKPDAPHLWAVLDESVLRRHAGSAKILVEQLDHLADLAERPNVSIQVVPSSVGAHAGLACSFAIGSLEGEPDLLVIDAVGEDQTISDPDTVRKAAVAFDLLRGDALSRGQSLDLIRTARSEIDE
jgi:DNA-binding XRE family transcriptional regulator